MAMQRDVLSGPSSKALGILKHAWDLEKGGRREEALKQYEAGVELLIRVVREAEGLGDARSRKWSEQCAHALARAEQIKKEIRESKSGGSGWFSSLFGGGNPPERSSSGPTGSPIVDHGRSRPSAAATGGGSTWTQIRDRPSASERGARPSGRGGISSPAKNTHFSGSGRGRERGGGGVVSPAISSDSSGVLRMFPVEKVRLLSAAEKAVAEETLWVPEGRGGGWDMVSGLESAKEVLNEAVVEPIRYPDVYTGLRAPPRGVLLFGPPGTGKTLLAKAVAVESGAAFFSVSASSLTSKWMGEGEKTVRALFGAARKLAPSVVFLDEVDSVLSSRGGGEHDSSRRMKTEFLVQLDGVAAPDTESGRVLLLAATNRPADLDDAVLRRMPARVYVALPDENARATLLAHIMRDTPHNITPQQFRTIARATPNYSASDLREVAREAAHRPVRDARAAATPLTPDRIRPVNAQDLQAAVSVVRASVNPESLAAYEAYDASFGSH